MDAAVIAHGEDHGNGYEDLASSMPPSLSASADAPSAAADAPHRRRRHGRGATLAKAAALLLIAGSASLILLQGTDTPTAAKAKAALQHHLNLLPTSFEQLQQSLSKTSTALLEDVPKLGHRVLEGTKATALSVQTFTAESAELAWEKSEQAFSQLTLISSNQEEKKRGEEQNPLERALEGIFHLRRRANEKDEGRRSNNKGGDGKNNNGKKNNLRKDGRNNNGNHSNKRQQQQRNLKSKEGGPNIQRRNNARADLQADVTSENPDSENLRNGWITLLTNSPLSTPLVAFCALLFLVASLLLSPNQPSQTIERENNTNLILDEDELEIVEFYEKEMECGTLKSIPFLQQDDSERSVEEFPIKRQSSCSDRYLMMNTSERNLGESSMLAGVVHRRSSSDPLLTRHHHHHHHHSGGEIMRESHGDLYYSRVLETLHYEVEEEEEVNSPMDEEGEGQLVAAVEDEQSCDEECQITLLENISSLSEENEGGDCTGTGNVDCQEVASPAPPSQNPQQQIVVDTEEGTCFESAQSEEQQGEMDGSNRPQSPPSSCSSISSLTSEGYDIEAPFGEGPMTDDTKESQGEASSTPLRETAAIFTPGPEQASRSLSLNASTASATNTEPEVSPMSATPPRSNLYQDRRASLIRRERKQSLSRKVSFSPEVKVCEIPRQTNMIMRHPQQRHGLSSESYLYIMLFTVAIAIAVFSLLPAHPSLSPIYSMTRGDMLSRAETMLNSQWDVEL